MDTFVARQPILDINKDNFAYELLFRDSLKNFMPDIDGDEATSRVLSSTFFTIGIETLSDNSNVFINFTEYLLLQKVPLFFPKNKTYIEILENIEPTPKVINALREFKEKGYKIALDDFVYESKFKPFIELADIIKIDFMATSTEEIKNYIQLIGPDKVQYLAEKIETNEEFESAVEMGFTLFQGYFFCKPEIVVGREISSSKITLMRMIAEVNNPDYEIEDLEEIISRDLSVSYKLFAQINSAYYARNEEINSIKEAIITLGGDALKRFVSFLSLAGLYDGSCQEVVSMSCSRARFCELVALEKTPDNSSELFLLGMFSMIDTILNKRMTDIIEQLPLPDTIVKALIEDSGDYADYLNLIKAYEQGQWDTVESLGNRIGIEVAKIPEIFLNACEWVRELG